MSVSRVQFGSRIVSVMCILALSSSTVLAQTGATTQSQPANGQATVQTPASTTAPNGPAPQQDYSKASPWWSYKQYVGKTVPAPQLNNAPRIGNLMRDGVMYLSLNDAIALALENNLDIAIARYNLNIADTDILRTKAGSATRGVNTGLVSGTPGGSGTGVTGASGGGAGGTSTGAGGAGSGTSGIVTSTSGVGGAVENFDPVLTGTLQVENSTQTLSNARLAGVPNVNQHLNTFNFGYQQGWATGTALSVTLNNSRTSTNSFTTLNPTLNTSMRATLRQHLLNGWGLENQRRFIIQARNNKRISDASFKLQVIQTVSQIQNIYWDLVNAYEDMKVKERSLEFANRTLSDNRKQVQIGTLAPIEIVRAESQVATSTQDLIVSQTNLQYQQLLMKNALSRNLSDATLAAAPVIPTDTMSIANEVLPPVQDLINTALSARAELLQSNIDLKNRELTRRTARNAMKPTVDAYAFYGGGGLSGNGQACAIDATGALICTPTGVTSGYGSAFSDIFNSSNPDKGIGLTLNIPIWNRAAQADQIRSELEYRQAQMRNQQLQNQIGIEVRNASYAVTQGRARIESARAARDFAAQSLDAEQKKYALGASTSYLVLQAQRDLTQADSNLVAAMAAYEKSRVELDRVTAATLDKNGIELAQAVTGDIVKTPVVPGVAPAPEPSIQSNQQVLQQMQKTPDQQMQELQQQIQQQPPQNPK